jgi:hypothetical protein
MAMPDSKWSLDLRVAGLPAAAQERRTQNPADGRLAAFDKPNSRLRDMMEPYMTDRQRRQLRKAESAARDAVS